MSAFHCVVVWERFDDDASDWLPYGPAVTQHLERAHAKQLTRVILSDADPSLRGCYVNLRTRTQCTDSQEGSSTECGVRRMCYPVSSPAGRGVRWERARSYGSSGDSGWDALPVDVQCRLEESWNAGDRTVDPGRGPGGLRRVQQAPYPLTRLPANPPARRPIADDRRPVSGRRTAVPQQRTDSAVSTCSSKSNHSQKSIAERAPAKLPAKEVRTHSGPPQRDKAKPNLARQILHNLNIFSNKSPVDSSDNIQNGLIPRPPSTSKAEGVLDVDSSSTRSGRRPSVDTVSTYLSHESKDSFKQRSIADLLDCSLGSDDAFESNQSSGRSSRPKTPSNGSIIGVDAASSVISGFVRAVESVQWGAVCPPCLRPLAPNVRPSHPSRVVVALSLCTHMMHLSCLNKMLTEQQRTNKGALYIQCPVCSKVYGEMRGNQPPGTMVWCLQSRSLPGQTAHTIQITYNVVSGVQGPEHPSPDRPYYAVGFPRHCYLPDTLQGRRVLNLLSIAWERRLIFTIRRSVTTGQDDIVSWNRIEHRTEISQFVNQQETAQFLERVIRQLNMRGVSDGQDEQGLYQELT